MQASDTSPAARTLRGALIWFVVAAVVRLALPLTLPGVVSRADQGGFGWDGVVAYLPMAKALVEGRGLAVEAGPWTAHMPGYPLMLAGGKLLTGSFKTSVLLIQGLCGAGCVALIWVIARRLFDRTVAHVSALIATFFPDLVVYSLLNLSDTPFLFLLLISTYLLMLLLAHSNPGLALLLGAATGASVLVREGGVAAMMCWTVLIVVLARLGNWRTRALLLVTMVAGFSVVMAPWWVRNAMVTGHFVPLTTKGGLNLYTGTLIRPYYFSDGRNDAIPLDEATRARERAVSDQARAAGSAFNADRVYLHAAWENVKTAPGRQLYHVGRKVLFLWQPNIGPRHAARFGFAPLLWLVAGLHFALVALGLTGILIYRKKPGVLIILGLSVLVTTIFYAVIGIGEPRYHLVAFPALIIGAAALLVGLGERIRKPKPASVTGV